MKTDAVPVQLGAPRARTRAKRPAGAGSPTAELAADLAAVVRGEVRFGDGDRAMYSTDASNYRQAPIGVVVPRTVDDIVAALAVCRRHHVPVLGRGGGTSLAGQCCNAAVVFDCSKYLRGIDDLDTESRRAVVQPGVVLDDLRDRAETVHLTFGPDPSTHDHCTLGGMIGNNSCGVHSVMAGMTADNVESLDIVTYDGVRMRVGATHDDDLTAIIAGGGRRGEIYAALRDLRDRYADVIRARFPRIPRRVSGYNLPALLPENGFDVAKALVGSECTCVMVLGATVRLVPSPPVRHVVVLGFRNIDVAADHVAEFVDMPGVIGLEGMDDELVEDMRRNGIHVGDVSVLPDGRGWLIVEVGAWDDTDTRAHVAAVQSRAESLPDAPTIAVIEDPQQQERLWRVREAGLGATARVPGQADGWPGWEDSSVPPERLGAYLRKLRALFDQYGYRASLYGHFGQGCVHCRVTFGLESGPGVAHWRAFLNDAAELVTSFGGSISGEHGDGQQRAELLPIMFGANLVEAFREFKSIWDPDHMMNPGKVVDARPITSDLRLGPDFDPPLVETHFSFDADGGDFARATLRCVGIGECRREDHGTMCPSYMVTHEEKHSTRGRAHLLFEMMEGRTLEDGWRSEAVRDALDLCLSCKGCKSDCPVHVDMATYKAEFLSHYYARRIRPRSAYAIGQIMYTARLAAKVPKLANALTHMRLTAKPLKWLAGVAPEREVPRFADQTFRTWFEQRRTAPGPRGPVLLWVDTWNNFFTPEIAVAATRVLEATGYEVRIPKTQLCCGRPLYDYGFLRQARRFLDRTITALRADVRAGVPLVGLEPSCVSVFRDEPPNMLPRSRDASRLAEATVTLGELLRRDDVDVPRTGGRALVHGHCHHKSVLDFGADVDVLRGGGVDVEVLDSGCCGMAGSFGFEAEHYDVSLACGERVLLPAARSAEPDQMIVTDGFSCREQIRQATGRRALHLAEVLARGIDRSTERTP
jgi:FAD/FMN-containing dehydrogenase/Fe-S oxidoreductase